MTTPINVAHKCRWDGLLPSLFLAIREASKRWRGVRHWKPALQVFQMLFGEERVPAHG